jgi:hypothetical protein
MTEWIQSEQGPECYCGWPTVVVVHENGLASLMCFGHTKEEGAMFPLPANKPDNWPNLTHQEMQTLVEQGSAEHEEKENEDE